MCSQAEVATMLNIQSTSYHGKGMYMFLLGNLLLKTSFLNWDSFFLEHFMGHRKIDVEGTEIYQIL